MLPAAYFFDRSDDSLKLTMFDRNYSSTAWTQTDLFALTAFRQRAASC